MFDNRAKMIYTFKVKLRRWIMAVPKHKTSKQRTHTRASQWKLKAPTVVECPHCHQLVQAHRVCPSCGHYDGVERIPMGQNDN